MRPRFPILLVLAIAIAGCAKSSDPAVSTADGSTTSTSQPAATTTAATGGSGSGETTPSTTGPDGNDASTTTSVDVDAHPAGFPATWFGVRDDLDAAFSHVEEHDATDGTVLREVAGYDISSCMEEDDDGECIMYGESWGPVALDVNEDLVAVGMCCEPVSGTTQLRERSNGELLVSPFGSEPAFAPTPPNLITAAYADGGYYFVVDSGTGASAELPVVPDWGDRASWSLDGTMIAVEIGDGIAVVFWDSALGEAVDVSPTFEPPAGTTWSKPAFQASGNLVVAQDGAAAVTTGVVLNRDAFGGLGADLVLAEFGYEGTVVHQGYDDSGRFLIYVLDDGSVRWQGTGSSGVLAPAGSGHLAAAW